MNKSNFYYPAALLFVIIVAGYLLYTGYFKKPHVDIAAYQTLCSRYLQAPAGTYTKDQMQLLVYKIDYLFPLSMDKLSSPPERDLKKCSAALNDRLDSQQ